MNAKSVKSWLFFFAALWFSLSVCAKDAGSLDAIAATDLPGDAQRVLALIRRGGPFPYAKDGVVFGNHEGVLPKQKRGYYHEFTVPTPGTRSRGARRIIIGGESASSLERYYTDDHYATFKRIKNN